jgi:hypothetical protein
MKPIIDKILGRKTMRLYQHSDTEQPKRHVAFSDHNTTLCGVYLNVNGYRQIIFRTRDGQEDLSALRIFNELGKLNASDRCEKCVGEASKHIDKFQAI